MTATPVTYFDCVLPPFPRSLVIEKGDDTATAIAVSRNGRVLFLSERPLGALVGARVFLALRPWFASDPRRGRRIRGTSVLVRSRAPSGRPAALARAVVARSEPADALAVLRLSPLGVLALVAAESGGMHE